MGASKINYPDMSGTQFSPGFGAGFSYSLFFSPRWSFLVGGGLQLFNNRGTDVNGNFTGVLPEANDFSDSGKDQVMLYYDFYGYTETQWSLMLMFPVMLQFQSNESRNKALYYALGVKLGFPFAGAYRGTAEKASVCGYYPNLWGQPAPSYSFADCNQDGFGQGFEDLGFGNYGQVSSYSRLKLGTAFFASAEAGVKWRLYNKLAVYTGFWIDLAMNDVALQKISGQPIDWVPTKGYSEDKITPKGEITFRSRTEGKAIPIALGFTFRLALGAQSFQTLDSSRWIREIEYRDSLLALCYEKADSLEMLKHRANALLDSLVECRGSCMEEAISKEALRRQLDSLEALRLAALEKARLDSLDRLRQILEAQKAARLEDFRKRLGALANGLDDYKITQTVPSTRAAEKLDTAAALMRDYPDLRIRITGHTCDKGTHETNLRIGIQRAQSAKGYLANSKGISPERIETATKAESEPIYKNIHEENRRKNRRVQIEIIEGIEKAEQEVK
jgi:outer membrane protein OmpA-like peptidoglycan-associated protein